MRVGLLSYNAQARDAVGNHVAETAAFFRERGAAVRLFVECADRLHPALRSCVQPVDTIETRGPMWDFLAGADLVIAQYAQAYNLLHFLPLLAGGKPRLLLDYHSVTPPALWAGPNRELLEQGQRRRGLVWCVDAAIAHSDFARQELIAATGFPAERIHVLPLVVDAARFHPGDDRSNGAANLLYVGRLAANKRVPLLVEALAELPAHVHAVVVGDTGDLYAAEAERCRSRARELNVADRLHLRGQVGHAELVEAYRRAAVLVVPSLHEGFCVPVVEAMACGLPVVAARAAALPETVGDAGLTFTPDDAADLARQVGRVLNIQPPPRRGGARQIAVVCFRFGADIVGGAETSLRTIALALQSAGHAVEVFTTCTRAESDWRNELPAGTTTCDALTVRRFPIDNHDRAAHLEAVRVIVQAAGCVSAQDEENYLRHSVHSTALVQALANRAETLDAIIVGPYLFGLSHDVARAFPERTLLLPCFHDERLAWLATWPAAYGAVGGMLLHSPEEKELTLARLGVNGPNVVEVGTFLHVPRAKAQADGGRAYVVYAGRYSEQKNLPLLLDWMGRYQQQRPGCVDLVCIGQGEVPLPKVPWLRDLGRVDEERKRAVLASALALVQLSQQESLSLVVLEAWAQGTPVIVHDGCAVLAGQVARSGGGVVVADYPAFASALDDPQAWRARGERGLAYVESRYGDRTAFVAQLLDAIDALAMPLRDRMRQRGLERAARCDRPAWRSAFGQVVESLLDAGPRPYRPALAVQPLVAEVRAGTGTRMTLVPVRVHNHGTHAVVADGPGRTVLYAEVRETTGAVVAKMRTDLPDLLVPGDTQTAMIQVPVPPRPGLYDLVLGAGQPDGERPITWLRLAVDGGPSASGLAPLFDGVRRLLADARAVERLPDDYLDVTQGRFGRWKRWIKQKLLNNFKRAYVDVLSRQQSQVNRQLVAAVEQLAECCAMLDHAVRTLQTTRSDAEKHAESAGAQEAHAPCSKTQGGMDA